MSIAVGIDLGTTNSCIACFKNGQVQVLENEDGDRTTRSFVYFNEKGEHVVGKTAVNKSKNPQSGIFDVKSLIGRKLNDASLQREIKNYPFEIVKGNDNQTLIKINYHKDKTLVKKPEEVSALVLKKLAKAAKDKLGDDFSNKAVITVPAYFNNDQRAATKEAGKLARLDVIRLLNEPTAAALAYVFDKIDDYKNKHLAVYDFGGGTFDISIILVNGRNVQVKAIAGDCNLGGRIIDDRLLDKFVDEIQAKYNLPKLKEDRRRLRRLRNACEELKIQLSFDDSGEIVLDNLIPTEETVSLYMTRNEFDREIKDIVNKTLEIVEGCVKDAKLECRDISEVLLVGGSSKIPIIQAELRNKFAHCTLSKKANFAEAVAEGAAIQAALLTANPTQAIEEIELRDVIPMSLGTGTRGDRMNFIINKNTPLPCKNTKVFKKIDDNQTYMTVEVYEGDDEIASKNALLEKMIIEGLTPIPTSKVFVTFSVDLDGILHVTAREDSGKISKELKISLNRRF